MTIQIIKRGLQYYRLYGWRKFSWAIHFKFRQGVKRIIRVLYILRDNMRSSHHYLEYQFFPALDRVNKPQRPASDIFRVPFVAIIADLSLPQCRKYRVVQKMEALEHLNIQAKFSHWEDIPRSMNILQMATFVIFYRLEDSALLDSYISECTRLQIPTAYDIDDPIFSREIYSENKNLDYLNPQEKNHLLESTQRYLQALQKFDITIVSTPRMALEVNKISGKPALLWRNAVDHETAASVKQLQPGLEKKYRTSEKDIIIAYASGSRAHEADFRVIQNILANILQNFPNVKLLIIGHLDLPDSLVRFKSRIFETGFSDYSRYISTLANADINIVPLVMDSFNDCKSGIRYMEAALLNVPTVAAAIGDFCNIIRNGENGFLAKDSDDWQQYLSTLIRSSDLRKKIGLKASQDVSGTLGIHEITNSLPATIKEMVHGRYR
ncbi:glycosyltransferase [Microbulbifer bruguierae]|uniref:Glycosyltransferase n=1 Tax=Microbulbifer bruguierae TaxID=3029061 RepID=A0ABY8NEE0_9GAMM|nr:glycosyltransferase [Microbulbifer bruguierae]WGL17288.1 glycosyltransferase [Microbulbifer bruguierae]